MLLDRPARALVAALVAASALLTGLLLAADDTRAARNLELAIQDDSLFLHGNKRWGGARPFRYARELGVTRIRANLHWSFTMPPHQFDALRKPSRIDYNFTKVDQLIDRARQHGIRVHLSLSGPTPRWANARKSADQSYFRPNMREFGQWVSIVVRHFKGRVDRYSIWNEPNWKTWLAPIHAAADIYRDLYVYGYRAIKNADRRAKVLIGETSPYGRPGLSTSPLAFLRKVTCVNKRYKRTGLCPRLKADGYAHHPYDFAHPPDYNYPGRDNVTMGTLDRLTRALDRLQRAGVLRKNGGGRMPVYLTEYGYFASGHRAVSAKKRTRYLKRAYSIALGNPRVKSQTQYLMLRLPGSAISTFDTGLVNHNGTPLPQYKALRSWYRSHRGKVKRPGRSFKLPRARVNPSR
jgi:hypothetical protein